VGWVSIAGSSMDARQSFHLGPKQDDFAEFAAEPNRSKDVDIPYATHSNDNVPARAVLLERFASSFNLPCMISIIGDEI
jgi:hypothetical protein